MKSIERQISIIRNGGLLSPQEHIAAFIKKNTPVKLSQVTAKYQRYDKEARADALENLLRNGSIDVVIKQGNGRPAAVITWIGE